MTKQQLAEYAGVRFYNLSSRPGGIGRDIHCLTVYEITENGTCKYLGEIVHCVANKKQWEYMYELTGGVYHSGRPHADVLTVEIMDKLQAAYNGRV